MMSFGDQDQKILVVQDSEDNMGMLVGEVDLRLMTRVQKKKNRQLQ
jgi:hypothetical protein